MFCWIFISIFISIIYGQIASPISCETVGQRQGSIGCNTGDQIMIFCKVSGDYPAFEGVQMINNVCYALDNTQWVGGKCCTFDSDVSVEITQIQGSNINDTSVAICGSDTTLISCTVMGTNNAYFRGSWFGSSLIAETSNGALVPTGNQCNAQAFQGNVTVTAICIKFNSKSGLRNYEYNCPAFSKYAKWYLSGVCPSQYIVSSCAAYLNDPNTNDYIDSIFTLDNYCYTNTANGGELYIYTMCCQLFYRDVTPSPTQLTNTPTMKPTAIVPVSCNIVTGSTTLSCNNPNEIMVGCGWSSGTPFTGSNIINNVCYGSAYTLYAKCCLFDDDINVEITQVTGTAISATESSAICDHDSILIACNAVGSNNGNIRGLFTGSTFTASNTNGNLVVTNNQCNSIAYSGTVTPYASCMKLSSKSGIKQYELTCNERSNYARYSQAGSCPNEYFGTSCGAYYNKNAYDWTPTDYINGLYPYDNNICFGRSYQNDWMYIYTICCQLKSYNLFTYEPTSMTTNPSIMPSIAPSINPTKIPTINPTINASSNPTTNPSLNPTEYISLNPTINPSLIPTINPLSNSTLNNTETPTINPSSNVNQSNSIMISFGCSIIVIIMCQLIISM